MARRPASQPFWRRKTLAELTPAEWESLCDGCGRCCLAKLAAVGDGPRRVAYTNVACRLFDGDACGCRDYPNRKARVQDCAILTPDNIAGLFWLPSTCAYRLVNAGKDLPRWHHLRSGSRDTVHSEGMSVRGRTVSEDTVDEADLHAHIVTWPRTPSEARSGGTKRR